MNTMSLGTQELHFQQGNVYFLRGVWTGGFQLPSHSPLGVWVWWVGRITPTNCCLILLCWTQKARAYRYCSAFQRSSLPLSEADCPSSYCSIPSLHSRLSRAATKFSVQGQSHPTNPSPPPASCPDPCPQHDRLNSCCNVNGWKWLAV